MRVHLVHCGLCPNKATHYYDTEGDGRKYICGCACILRGAYSACCKPIADECGCVVNFRGELDNTCEAHTVPVVVETPMVDPLTMEPGESAEIDDHFWSRASLSGRWITDFDGVGIAVTYKGMTDWSFDLTDGNYVMHTETPDPDKYLDDASKLSLTLREVMACALDQAADMSEDLEAEDDYSDVWEGDYDTSDYYGYEYDSDLCNEY